MCYRLDCACLHNERYGLVSCDSIFHFIFISKDSQEHYRDNVAAIEQEFLWAVTTGPSALSQTGQLENSRVLLQVLHQRAHLPPCHLEISFHSLLSTPNSLRTHMSDALTVKSAYDTTSPITYLSPFPYHASIFRKPLPISPTPSPSPHPSAPHPPISALPTLNWPPWSSCNTPR